MEYGVPKSGRFKPSRSFYCATECTYCLVLHSQLSDGAPYSFLVKKKY